MILPAPSRWALQPCLPDSISSTLTKNKAAASTMSTPKASMSCRATCISCSALCLARRASLSAQLDAAPLAEQIIVPSPVMAAMGGSCIRLDMCAAEAATMTCCNRGWALVSGRRPRNGLRSGMSCETKSWQRRLVTDAVKSACSEARIGKAYSMRDSTGAVNPYPGTTGQPTPMAVLARHQRAASEIQAACSHLANVCIVDQRGKTAALAESQDLHHHRIASTGLQMSPEHSMSVQPACHD